MSHIFQIIPVPPVHDPYIASSNPSGFIEGIMWISVVSTSCLISLSDEYDSSKYFANWINNSRPMTSFPCMFPTYLTIGLSSFRSKVTLEEIWRTHRLLFCTLSSDNLYNLARFGYWVCRLLSTFVNSSYVWYLVSVGSPKVFRRWI